MYNQNVLFRVNTLLCTSKKLLCFIMLRLWIIKAGIVNGVGRLHPNQVAVILLHKGVQHLCGGLARPVALVHHNAVHILGQ